MMPERFRDASWDGAALVIDVGAFRHRVVPLVRPVDEPEI
jgi:hypothetical protein